MNEEKDLRKIVLEDLEKSFLCSLIAFGWTLGASDFLYLSLN